MWVTPGKSRVRESRMPGSVRAKPNGLATRPAPGAASPHSRYPTTVKGIAVGQWVCRVKDGRIDAVSMQPRPYGSMTYEEALTIGRSTDWMDIRYPEEYPEVRAHTLNLHALDYLGRLLINASHAPKDGTLTVQTTKAAGPQMRVVYRPLQANQPIVGFIIPDKRAPSGGSWHPSRLTLEIS